MKALSLLQPWASLVAMGLKTIETRSWKTSYRGELYIHASAKDWKPKRGDEKLLEQMVSSGYFDNYKCITYGAIIGKVKLMGCIPVEEIVPSILTAQEKIFGDYTAGRYGWLMSEPVLFDTPIPCRGQLSIWNCDGIIAPAGAEQGGAAV